MRPAVRATLWGSIAALYFVVTTLAHLEFSLWLVASRSAVIKDLPLTYTLRDFMPHLLPLIALAWTVWMVRSARKHGSPIRIAIVCSYWILWIGCVAGVDRWLTYSVAEYFHYPQYALLAILLAKTIDPQHAKWPIIRLLLVTTLLGALDELAQYTWITISYSNYYDFNDVLVNLLAAAMGVMLYYGFRIPPEPQAVGTSRLQLDQLNIVLVLVLLVFCSGGWLTHRAAVTPPAPVPPGGILVGPSGQKTLFLQRNTDFFGSWQPGIRHGRYHVLTPTRALGLVVTVFLIWGFWPLPPRDLGSRRCATHKGPPISP